MLRHFAYGFVAVVLLSMYANAANEGHDYPPFAMIDGYSRDKYNEQRFDFYDFKIDKSDKKTHVEGKKIAITYGPKEGDTGSGLEIIRTIVSQLQSVKARILFQKPDNDLIGDTALVARFEKNGSPIWLSVQIYNNAYELTVVEEKEFHPAAHLSQSDIQSAIEKEGRVTLHVNFDFDRTTLRPDAQPIIQEIVGVMKNAPNLKLEVDGHTDGIGSDNYNQTLSEGRAKAVVAALVSNGIDGKRLTWAGLGASNPVADNTSEQGRAENRRVELVRR